MFRSAYSFIPQATVADMIAKAIMDSFKVLAPFDTHAILQVHDEIDFITPDSQLQNVLPLIKSLMEFPVYFEGISAPLIIPAEISYGPNWFDQTDWKA